MKDVTVLIPMLAIGAAVLMLSIEVPRLEKRVEILEQKQCVEGQ